MAGMALTAKRLLPRIEATEMKDYYENRAPEYDATSWEHPETSDEERSEQEDLLSALASLPPAKTLDVGCGTGYLSRHLPGDVVATDYSDAMLREARIREPSMKLVRADAFHLPFRDRCFQRLVATFFYGHLEPPQEVRFLAEARRAADQLVIVDSAPKARVSPNDFEERILADGSRHLIYKRFFDAEDLLHELGGGTVLFAGSNFVAVEASTGSHRSKSQPR